MDVRDRSVTECRCVGGNAVSRTAARAAVALGGTAPAPTVVDGGRRNRYRARVRVCARELRVMATVFARRRDLPRRVLLGCACPHRRRAGDGDRALHVRPGALRPLRHIWQRDRVPHLGGDHRAGVACAGTGGRVAVGASAWAHDRARGRTLRCVRTGRERGGGCRRRAGDDEGHRQPVAPARDGGDGRRGRCRDRGSRAADPWPRLHRRSRGRHSHLGLPAPGIRWQSRNMAPAHHHGARHPCVVATVPARVQGDVAGAGLRPHLRAANVVDRALRAHGWHRGGARRGMAHSRSSGRTRTRRAAHHSRLGATPRRAAGFTAPSGARGVGAVGREHRHAPGDGIPGARAAGAPGRQHHVHGHSSEAARRCHRSSVGELRWERAARRSARRGVARELRPRGPRSHDEQGARGWPVRHLHLRDAGGWRDLRHAQATHPRCRRKHHAPADGVVPRGAHRAVHPRRPQLAAVVPFQLRHH